MPDPRKDKKFLMRVFGGEKAIYKDYLTLYDEAVAEGSAIPEDLAWIRFREIYAETDEGWTRL